MATDSWALAVDEQEAAVKSMTNLQIKEEKEFSCVGIIKTSTTAEKTDEEEKEDRAAQSLLNKLIRSNLVDNTNQVEVLQRDPNSPLYASKQFQLLGIHPLSSWLPRKPQLLQGVYAMGFNRPSKIQENALPMMLAEPPQNLIAQSQSGTGKTAAFVLAMLSRVEPADRYPQCLCLSPTYELALQTGKVIEQMGKFYPELKLAYAVRGNKLERGQKISEQIVIGTPGTVLDWCSKLKSSLPDQKYLQLSVTRKTASWLAAELSKEGHQVALLSGEMMVEQRAAVIERFREGKEKVLVTTNVCARGIDVEQVSVVINFDLPVDKDGNPDNETYLHRIGRTGRFGKRGLAVNMVDSKHSMNILNRIQEHFNKKIERLDTDDLDEIEKIAN
nr:ATP-dependent RNA helicase DDX19A-like [Macaca nemestrina]